ncbi:inactive dipeptidyl peptidase 10 isoform X2 [Phlebotomus papatasi]|uniref:inactive dipeptidyl peptidase 10 isoform X2 n=1 Tax=Phlebotomus papatasi TaxID=29031 RepID=UPI002483E6C2|nr:inactive dipeptidyl peptidase 10 isoform X2 [Phlebotomus papatasi]
MVMAQQINKSNLKSNKRETIVVNTPIKKVTLIGKDEELVASSPGRRNWRGIFIALLVIAAVLGLIVFSIFLLSPEDEGNRIKGHMISISDVLSGRLKWQPFNGSWISDTELVYRDVTGGLSILDLDTYTVRSFMTNSSFRQLDAKKFLVSPNLQYVLLLWDETWEGSKVNVFEVDTLNTYTLSAKDDTREAPIIQYILWAPKAPQTVPRVTPTNTTNEADENASKKPEENAKLGTSQAIAFVYNNDLYYKPKVQSDLVCRITTTGKKGVIYNGIPNWMYSNISDLRSDTIAFSPDGLYLSFLSFNDTQVKEYRYTYVGEGFRYPEVRSVRYPKANTPNPVVTVYVVNLSVLKYIFPQPVRLPSSVLANTSYVGGMLWASATDLSITFTNRQQTVALTVLCRAPQFVCREVYPEYSVDNITVLPTDRPIYSRRRSQIKPTTIPPTVTTSEQTTTPTTETNATDTNKTDTAKFEFEIGGFLLKRLPVRDGMHGYFRHVVFVSPTDSRSIPLTMGRFEVTEILGWDEKREIVYFMAAPEHAPGQRHLYRINLKLNFTERTNRVYVTTSPPICLTCINTRATFHSDAIRVLSVNETAEDENFYPPNNCLYNQITFSHDYTYYVQECLGPDSPSIYVVDTQANLKVFVLNDGSDLRERLAELALPQIRSLSVEMKDGSIAQVRLFIPPGMRDGEEVAFPLILHIDGAPGSQLVSEKFCVDWNWYLASKLQMIVAQIDGRGSGFRGEKLRSEIIGYVGNYEVDDQLAVLMYIRDTFPFIDRRKICSYGWGYGGYASASALLEDSQRVLQCSVAVNPIVSFAYHNSFFTERYIPQNENYLRVLQESDLMSRVQHMESRNFLLVHGTADTMVHQQHSLIFARELIEHGISFRHQIYTDEDHGLDGVLYHVYKTMEDYFDEMFGPPEKDEWDPTGLFTFKQ